MKSSFHTDEYPGRPRILFVGLPDSSHTHSWIGLLDGAPFNARLFAMPSVAPPDGWPVPTYVTYYHSDVANSATRLRLLPRGRAARFAWRHYNRLRGVPDVTEAAARWLAEVIREWQPHVVHTMGLEQSDFYFRARRKYGLEGGGKWVLQTLGGADLVPGACHLNQQLGGRVGEVLRACDQLVGDNAVGFDHARAMGVGEEKLSDIGTVPGTGGVEVETLAAKWDGPPSRRRVILWPKAYECPWSKALPVFEALKLCWGRLPPCEIHLLAMMPETWMWFRTLPAEIRASCRATERIPRADVLELMTRARVMLAPSLVDGVPNTLLEAMAAGAFPVVSPLETILPLVAEGENVLFARNLYPEEIAGALVRAMTDDALVDDAAARNLALVRRVANRAEIRERVLGFYERLAAGGARVNENGSKVN